MCKKRQNRKINKDKQNNSFILMNFLKLYKYGMVNALLFRVWYVCATSFTLHVTLRQPKVKFRGNVISSARKCVHEKLKNKQIVTMFLLLQNNKILMFNMDEVKTMLAKLRKKKKSAFNQGSKLAVVSRILQL